MDKSLLCTANQMLLLDKTEIYRNQTIDMALKLNIHLDKDVLLKTINEEIKRNDCLRLKAKKHLFKWYNEFSKPFTIDSIKTIDLSDKSEEEIHDYIDSMCSELIVLKTAKMPFEFYHLVGKDADYLLFRILHVNMDAYSTLLTFADIVKVYFSIANNTPLTDELTSVQEFIEGYNSNIENIKTKIKNDTEYFIEKNKAMGEPTYMGCEGGFDGSEKRFKINIFKNHPVKYVSTKVDADIINKIQNYCKDNRVNVASLFLSAIELYCSSVNNNFKDISLFYTSDFRSKLSEKNMPLTNSTAIFFRRIINEDLSFKEFVKECDGEYFATLKHVQADIAKIYQYLINLKLLDLNGRYDQIVYSFIPVSFNGIPGNVDVEPYWPKCKGATDFIIYNIVVPNKDGSFNAFYRYMTDVLEEDDIINLHNGLCKLIEEGINNPDMKVSEALSLVK